MNIKRSISWVLWILWCLVIFFFSSQNGSDSGAVSSGLLEFIQRFLPMIQISSLMIRKFAHFTEFFILGILTFHLFRQYRTMNLKTVLYATLFCVFYSASDELHQLFIMNRGPSVMDVCIDIIGSFSAIMILYVMKRKK